MTSFTLVTGSRHKAEEWQRLMPADVSFATRALDLVEIQSLQPEEIVTAKVQEAYRQLGTPLVVEDVSAGVDALNGLPGPFIKFFELALGRDALFRLGGEGGKVTISCTAAYFDGKQLIIGRGVVHGRVTAMKTDAGFGFDAVFVPEGYKQTFGEMGSATKDAISHRRLAADDLLRQLREL